MNKINIELLSLNLAQKQKDVLSLLLEYKTVAQIAEKLKIVRGSVYARILKIFAALMENDAVFSNAVKNFKVFVDFEKLYTDDKDRYLALMCAKIHFGEDNVFVSPLGKYLLASKKIYHKYSKVNNEHPILLLPFLKNISKEIPVLFSDMCNRFNIDESEFQKFIDFYLYEKIHIIDGCVVSIRYGGIFQSIINYIRCFDEINIDCKNIFTKFNDKYHDDMKNINIETYDKFYNYLKRRKSIFVKKSGAELIPLENRLIVRKTKQ